VKRALALAVVAVALAGCGGTTAGKGTATLWVTRDRGAHVLMVKRVPAGLTAMQALDRAADIETAYGGRYVQAIDGVEGSLSGQHDWFFFVNGIEGDRSAAEVKLHPGDIEWWDYRSWAKQMQQPVVVGAFPEPFLRGRTTVVARAGDKAIAQKIATLTHGSVGSSGSGNVIRIVPGRGFTARLDGSAVSATLGIETARRLVRDPSAVRYRYEVP
jgi:uncharacterized protein DUF4430